MTGEPTDEEIEAFDRLVFKAALLHGSTWCVKRQRPRFTACLQGRVCLSCKEFVLNGGICDPL